MTSEHSPAWPASQPGPLRTGQDWATWLRQTARGQSPGSVRPPGRMGVPGAWNTLVHVARRAGFAVVQEDCGDAEAFTTWPDRRIHVNANAAPVQAVTALAHQIGHVLLHRETARLDPSRTVPCHGLRKVEADSVAYLTAISLGIGTQAIGFPNVSAWAGTDPRANPAATVRAVASRVLAATDTILTHLDTGLPQASAGNTRAITADTAHDLFGTPQPSPPLAEIARLNEIAARYFHQRLAGSWVPGYLSRRGFTSGVQQRWTVGYAPTAWDELTCHLRSLGYPDTLIAASGLARRSRRGTLTDTFRDRAILPIRSPGGATLGFIGRAPAHASRGVPKYLNTPSTGLYDKSEVLFGLREAREELAAGARPVVVEGPLDAIAATIASPGQYAGIATCGTALTAQHAAALTHAISPPATGLLVGFDSDQAGRRASVRAYHLLSRVPGQLSAAIFPPGQDPAQVLADRGPDALARMLRDNARPLADLVVDAEVNRWGRWLHHAEGQINALRATAPLIAAMRSSDVSRQVARLADRLGLDHSTVTEAVTDALPEVIARAQPRSSPAQLQRGPPPPNGGHTIRRDFPVTAQQTTRQAPSASSHDGEPSRHATQRSLRPRRVPG